jgi:hypothetical protein
LPALPLAFAFGAADPFFVSLTAGFFVELAGFFDGTDYLFEIRRLGL